MRRLRENGLSVVILAVFVATMAGQVWSGFLHHNEELVQHGRPEVGLPEYLRSGHMWQATAENWESEFLQMAAYVLFTIGLFQKGSSESKDPNKQEAVDRDPRQATGKRLASAPWPVRKGGWLLNLYEHSLSIAFAVLFILSFALHAVAGTAARNDEELVHGGAPVSALEYLGTSQFWFEAFQNWQSDFLSLVAMVVFTIWLRQRGSPESKPVDAPHSHTGSE